MVDLLLLPFTIMLMKIDEAASDLREALEERGMKEPEYRQEMIKREKKMSEIDNLGYTDEEIEMIADIQMKSNPYQRKSDEAIKRLYKVMNDG